MAVLQEYKCPCCGGVIAFDSTVFSEQRGRNYYDI